MASNRQSRKPLLAISSGAGLAVLFALLAILVFPERDPQANAAASAASINYEVLDRGANLAELERGRVYFNQLCVSCHGARGDGRGEWAYRVTPAPSDLTSTRVQQRSDEFLFLVVSDGLAGSAMIGWKQGLSERQLWQIVGFIRHLGARQTPDGGVGS